MAFDPLIPALNAAALAYRVAPFPFKHEPWAAARCVIDETGKVHINPSRGALRAATASLLIAATRSKIVWMDALASQGRTLSEQSMQFVFHFALFLRRFYVALDKILKRGLEAVHSALSSQDALVAARAVPPLSVSAKLVVPNKEVQSLHNFIFCVVNLIIV